MPDPRGNERCTRQLVVSNFKEDGKIKPNPVYETKPLSVQASKVAEVPLEAVHPFGRDEPRQSARNVRVRHAMG